VWFVFQECFKLKWGNVTKRPVEAERVVVERRRDYIARHRPILLLKFDGNLADDWPHTDQGSTLGPYCAVHESFSPSVTIYGFVEQARAASRVVSPELTDFTQSLGRFTPKEERLSPASTARSAAD
jgi:hypothetical protein